MHETSLGYAICDYLTGRRREATTYEDLRQGLARLMVEERGFAPEALRPGVEVPYQAGGENFSRPVDLLALDQEGRPLLAVVFCPGEVNTYRREVLSLARLLPGGPVPLALVTDTRKALLLCVASGADLPLGGQGAAIMPLAGELPALAAACPAKPLTPERRDKESRILHTYSGFIKDCCSEVCLLLS